MIKINLVREGKAVRGGSGVAAAAPTVGGGAGTSLNNVLVIGLALVGLLAAAGYWFLKYSEKKSKQEQVASQRLVAQSLESIIAEVESYQRRKDALENRIKTINDLKQRQKGPVRLLDRISQDLPDLVWLDKLELSGALITVDGRGLNPNAIANFVENVKADPLFDEPEVQAINQQPGVGPNAQNVYNFQMSFAFTYTPPAAGTPAQTTTAGTPGGAPGAAGAAPGS